MTRAFVSPGVVSGLQILLVIVFGIPPLARGQDLRDHLTLPPLLVHQLGYLLGNFLLLGIVEEDGRPVLRARVGSLSVPRRGVMHPVEEF